MSNNSQQSLNNSNSAERYAQNKDELQAYIENGSFPIFGYPLMKFSPKSSPQKYWKIIQSQSNLGQIPKILKEQ